MERVRFIEYKSTRLLFIDFSGLGPGDEMLHAIAAAREFVASRPEHSLLTLTDVTGADFDEKTAMALWDLLRHNRRYVRAGAVVGVRGQQQLDLYRLLTHQTKRRLAAFETPDEAKDWLAAAAGPRERGAAAGRGSRRREIAGRPGDQV